MPQIFKRSLFTLFFLGMTIRMLAQEQQYFVYIQSERSQPFYVRYDGKLIPSSDRGYLILSKMPAGTASLRIGFAKSDAPERQYQVRITGPADQGYLLKQDGDRGYALFNLQTFAVIRPGEEKKKEAVAAAEAPATEVAPAQETAPAPEVAANVPETAPATASADTALVPASPVPAPPAPVSEDEQKRAMMASLKKDLDSTFPAKSGVAVGPGTRPVKQSNKFSQALDKVVSDDRPDDIVLEEPQAPAVAAPAAETTAVAPAGETTAPKKQRRRRREREPLTEEEKQLASAILAEENKATEQTPKDQPIAEVTPAAVPPVTEPAPPATQPVAETASPSTEPVASDTQPVKEETPAVTKKEKKQRKKKADDPAFIDFVDTGGHQAPPAGSVAAPAPATGDASVETAVPAEETPAGNKKKKRSKLAEKIDTIDATERPNNVVNDPTGYEVTDLSIDHAGKKDKKKKKDTAGEGVDVAAPVVTEAAPAAKSSSLKMINSDCGKVMDDETFRKMLRKFVAGKDDDGMLDAFRKQTKGYCLESSQIKTLVQLMGTDESRYRLLDLAYPKAYHSDEYAGMESLLSDSYYKGRFRAMLHK
ncbi:hypothetical protein L3C95_34870 [Chitinophaga filiformis]|uniref:DUF4476 domain-containing protein n=1 Tax=Chitinophaga filiformis TaxID=104663 RepID=UPI001F34ACC5|nr:DUF4476 domain-containing protein [Chitinophaga filiformis]MCF6408124.1 hypothetical protein [Chitinophaga filiformis]